MNLFKASKQWASRPADERFWNLMQMYTACVAYAKNSMTSLVKYGDLRVEAREGDMLLMGKTNVPATLTNYAMGQLCQRIKAPETYITRLPATLAAQNLNYGLANQREPEDTTQLLLHKNGSLLARCLNGERYKRIWNYEIIKGLLDLEEKGWRVPPARPPYKIDEKGQMLETRIATQEDCIRSSKLGLEVKPGDLIAPAGLYAGDRDMFVFMINEDAAVKNPLCPDVPLTRGFFLWNSEVGDRTFGITTFLLDAVCGNHICFGARDVMEFKVRHIGEARMKAFKELQVHLTKYSNLSVSDDQAMIEKSQTFQIAATKEEVIEKVLSFAKSKKLVTLTEGAITDAIEIAEKTTRYGNPRTPWAINQGLTVLSQQSEYASKRVDMDREAGKVLEMAF